MKYLIAVLFVFTLGCSSTKDINWVEDNNYVIIQISQFYPQVESYYAEITLESQRRIALELGLPDKDGKFKVINNFGKFTDINVYTYMDLDLE